MSNKKKPVGMALDITTGKSYKVYKPEPVSEQMPPEPIPVSAIGQIKIGDVLLVCDDNIKSQHKVQDILPPTKDHGEEVILDTKKNVYFSTNLVLSGESWAKRVFIVERAPITLTLTREQAGSLRSGLIHIQWWNLSEKTKNQIVQIEKQIEEKLK